VTPGRGRLLGLPPVSADPIRQMCAFARRPPLQVFLSWHDLGALCCRLASITMQVTVQQAKPPAGWLGWAMRGKAAGLSRHASSGRSTAGCQWAGTGLRGIACDATLPHCHSGFGRGAVRHPYLPRQRAVGHRQLRAPPRVGPSHARHAARPPLVRSWIETDARFTSSPASLVAP
jgi:hypothetical protein